MRSVIRAIISDDRPGHWFTSSSLISILAILLLAPLILDQFQVAGSSVLIMVAIKVAVFIVLAASYDMLIGYTSITSLAHAVFFSIGAYSVAISLRFCSGDPTVIFICSIFIGVLVSVIFGGALAVLGLRVKGLFFTMLTFAIAAGTRSVIIRFESITGGLDGATMDGLLPSLLEYKVALSSGLQFRAYAYYGIVIISIMLFLLMLRVVNSPFGTVLKAIRENEFRASAVGYNVKKYKISIVIISSAIASLAGALYVTWVRSVVPNTFLDFDIMLMILIIVIIGGKGTLYGSVIGATIMILLTNRLNPYLAVLFDSDFPEKLQVLLTDPFSILDRYYEYIPIRRLFSNKRWPLYIGIFYIISVYFFSNGIVGRLRVMALSGAGLLSLRGYASLILSYDWKKVLKFGYRISYLTVFLSAIGQVITGLFTIIDDNGWVLIMSGVLTYLIGCSGIFVYLNTFLRKRFFYGS